MRLKTHVMTNAMAVKNTMSSETKSIDSEPMFFMLLRNMLSISPSLLTP